MADYTDDTDTIEEVTTEAAPAAGLAVDAASEPSDAGTPPKPQADDSNSVDPFNQSAGDRSSFDKINKGIAADRVAGDKTLGEAGGGPLNQEAPEEKKEREEEEFWEYMHELDEEREKAAREFDEKMHKIGNYEYSGKELMAMKKWLDNDQNAEAFENDLMQKHGISKEEAKKRRMNAQEYLKILEKERNSEPLTEEEKRRKRELEPAVAKDIHTLSEWGKKSGMEYGHKESSITTGQTAISQKSSSTARNETIDSIVSSLKAETATPPNQKDFEKTMFLTQKQKTGLLTDAERLQLNMLQSDPNVIAAVGTHFSKMKEQAEAAKTQTTGDSLTASTIKASPLVSTFERADSSPIPLDKDPVLKSDAQRFAQAKTSTPSQTTYTF